MDDVPPDAPPFSALCGVLRAPTRASYVSDRSGFCYTESRRPKKGSRLSSSRCAPIGLFAALGSPVRAPRSPPPRIAGSYNSQTRIGLPMHLIGCSRSALGGRHTPPIEELTWRFGARVKDESSFESVGGSCSGSIVSGGPMREKKVRCHEVARKMACQHGNRGWCTGAPRELRHSVGGSGDGTS